MTKPLTPEEKQILIDKGTEPPFTGEYDQHDRNGLYTCRQCDSPLYTSHAKFDAHCGWPAFDDELSDAVQHTPDPDGSRTEITCQHCQGHLGHVFTGEHLTDTNVRHCVNSLSMTFLSMEKLVSLAGSSHERYGLAYFAAGCFWGVESDFLKQPFVLATEVGYLGGKTDNPTYEQVCRGNTGHAESIRVIYDKQAITYEALVEFFFSIHDPALVDRQGRDVGNQYRSHIFYVDDEQKTIAQTLIHNKQKQGKTIATQLSAADTFWPAEEFHQKYHERRR